MKILVFVLLCFSLSNCELPSYIKKCQEKDPNLNKCIINSIRDLLPQLKKGIAELDVPPIEPLDLGTIDISTGLQSNISNLKVFGVSSLKFKDLHVDLKNKTFIFKIVIPQLNFKGDYDLDMNILFIKIKGHGAIKGNIENYFVELKMNGNLEEKEGKQYLQFEKFVLKVRHGEAQLHLDNLFNGDPILGQITNSVINSNIDIILDDLTPVLESSLSEKLTDIANKITAKVSYEEMFLHDL